MVRQRRAGFQGAEEDAASDEEAALGLRAKADVARSALTKETQEIIEEVRRLGRRTEEAVQLLKSLARDQAGLTGRKSKAETVLEQVEERRKEAEAERKRCVDRWLGCVDSGLPDCAGSTIRRPVASRPHSNPSAPPARGSPSANGRMIRPPRATGCRASGSG